MSKKPKGNNTAVVVLLTILIFVMIALTGLVIWMCVNLVNKTPQTTVRTETQIYTLPTVIRTEPTQAETQPPETTLPEPGACGGYRFHRHHGRSADAQAGV